MVSPPGSYPASVVGWLGGPKGWCAGWMDGDAKECDVREGESTWEGPPPSLG